MSESSEGLGILQGATAKSKRSNKWRAGIIIAGAIVLMAVVGIVIAVQLGGTSSEEPAAQASPSAISSSTADPSASDAQRPTSTGQAAAVEFPSDCDALYTPSMLDEFSQLVLNPEWSKTAGEATLYGTDDQELQLLMDTEGPLVCLWGDDDGGGDVGLTTSVVSVNSAVETAVEARLRALNHSCYEQLRGLRCVMSQSSEDATSGESHFLRDGLWVATKWVNFAPENYTESVVENLWGSQ
jgi:hypothetical protein